MTATRFTEAELAELDMLVTHARDTPGAVGCCRVHMSGGRELESDDDCPFCRDDELAILTLIDVVPRLVAAARLANEQRKVGALAALNSVRDYVKAGYVEWNEAWDEVYRGVESGEWKP